MSPSELGEDEGLNDEETPKIDLMCGIGLKAIRMLCEGGMEGIYGYTPNQIGSMTLDQILLLLAQKEHLKRPGNKMRTVQMTNMEATSIQTDEHGMVAGRLADGTPIKARIGGESLASRLRREQAEQAEKDRRRALNRNDN